jgi:hypothetical protein
MQSITPDDLNTLGDVHAKLDGVLQILNSLDVRSLERCPEDSLNKIMGRIDVIRATSVQLRTRLKQQLKQHTEAGESEDSVKTSIASFKGFLSRPLGSQKQNQKQFLQGSALRKAKNSEKAQRRAAKADFADRIATLQREAEDEQSQQVDWALAILGASRSTHASELKALYRYMVRKTHPDGRVASPDSVDAPEPDSHQPSFEVVQQAWEVLVSSGRVIK